MFLKKKYILYKELMEIRRFKLKLNLNKYKFEEKFLFILSKLISRFYNKKIEFNIVNLKSIMFNTDLFTEILASKLRKKKASHVKLINIFLTRFKIPEVGIGINRILERTRIVSSINRNLIWNKLNNFNLINFIFNLLNAIINTSFNNNLNNKVILYNYNNANYICFKTLIYLII